MQQSKRGANMRKDDIRIVHRVVGTKHVFTSPDVPGLHVSDADKDTAEGAIQSALDMLDRMQERLDARRDIQLVQSERLYA
jgi:hypothetical protein